jgi:hypothetical protein
LSHSTDGSWTHTVLYEFAGTGDGSMPQYDVTVEPNGIIYGIASEGGTGSGCIDLGCGVVYKLTQGAHGTWTETVMHTFRNGGDGYVPVGTLIFGNYGLIYGATTGGGIPSCSFGGFGCGSIFSLTP